MFDQNLTDLSNLQPLQIVGCEVDIQLQVCENLIDSNLAFLTKAVIIIIESNTYVTILSQREFF